MSCQQNQKQCQPLPKYPEKSPAQCLPATSSCCAASSGGSSVPSNEGGCCLSHHRRRSHRGIHRCRSSGSCDCGSGHSSGDCC